MLEDGLDVLREPVLHDCTATCRNCAVINEVIPTLAENMLSNDLAGKLDSQSLERLTRLDLSQALLDTDDPRKAIDLLEMVLRVSAVDPSAGWCVATMGGHSLLLRSATPDALRQLATPLGMLGWVATAGGGTGEARQTDDGTYRISGSWRFSSFWRESTSIVVDVPTFTPDTVDARDTRFLIPSCRFDAAEAAAGIIGLRATNTLKVALNCAGIPETHMLGPERPLGGVTLRRLNTMTLTASLLGATLGMLLHTKHDLLKQHGRLSRSTSAASAAWLDSEEILRMSIIEFRTTIESIVKCETIDDDTVLECQWARIANKSADVANSLFAHAGSRALSSKYTGAILTRHGTTQPIHSRTVSDGESDYVR